MRHVFVADEGRIADVYGGDSERRRPFIADGGAGRGGDKAQEAIEKARKDAREESAGSGGEGAGRRTAAAHGGDACSALKNFIVIMAKLQRLCSCR
jgi:hypothetical protein